MITMPLGRRTATRPRRTLCGKVASRPECRGEAAACHRSPTPPRATRRSRSTPRSAQPATARSPRSGRASGRGEAPQRRRTLPPRGGQRPARRPSEDEHRAGHEADDKGTNAVQFEHLSLLRLLCCHSTMRVAVVHRSVTRPVPPRGR